MIRIGTAGWQYRDWAGTVYPKPKPRGFDELSYLANFFDVVEINSSFYGPPRPTAARAWAKTVAHRPDFRFTAKLWQGYTHTRNATAADEKLFKDGVEPLVDEGRLGALLLQFPWSFKNEPENRAYVRTLRERFADYPLVLEVRHSSWMDDDWLDTLAEPLFHRSVKPSAFSTSRIGYIRMHGRNYKQCFPRQRMYENVTTTCTRWMSWSRGRIASGLWQRTRRRPTLSRIITTWVRPSSMHLS